MTSPPRAPRRPAPSKPADPNPVAPSPAASARGTRTVTIPEEVAAGIASRIEGSAFDSVDAFVSFVLARLLEEPGGPGLSEEDERTLKERLRSLGYID